MALLTSTWVQENFENWEDFCTIDSGETPATVLARKTQRAEDEFSAYLSRSASDITPAERLLLLALIKKHCFDLQHGDTEYEHPPQILRDYDSAIKTLAALRDGIGGPNREARIQMSAKTKVFGENDWFTDQVTTADDAR